MLTFAFPAPRFDLIDLDSYLIWPAVLPGLPVHCEFCDITLMLGRRVRTKTPGQILKDCRFWTILAGEATSSLWTTTSSAVPQGQAAPQRVDPWMGDRGHPFDFFTQASVNLGSDPELLDLMVRPASPASFWESRHGRGQPGRAGKLQNVQVDLDEACGRINRAGYRSLRAASSALTRKNPGRTNVYWILRSAPASPSCLSPCFRRDREPTCGTGWQGRTPASHFL